MKIVNRKYFRRALCMLAAFFLWTGTLRMIDVQPAGPLGSSVGFASVNRFVHSLTGVNMVLYQITDWLSVIPLGFMVGFAFLGLVQWIRRKGLRHVDRSILILGGFYAVVIAIYVLFEVFPVNYRPVLIEGVLEASYPSSTTMLVMCILPTTILQFKEKIRNQTRRRQIIIAIRVLMWFMVLGRFLSGVHWFTDIVGGALLSAGLVLLYGSFFDNL